MEKAMDLNCSKSLYNQFKLVTTKIVSIGMKTRRTILETESRIASAPMLPIVMCLWHRCLVRRKDGVLPPFQTIRHRLLLKRRNMNPILNQLTIQGIGVNSLFDQSLKGRMTVVITVIMQHRQEQHPFL